MNSNEKAPIFEMPPQEIIAVLLDRVWIVILSGIVCALVSYLYTAFLVTPLYQSKTSMYVLNTQSPDYISSIDISSATSLTKDYSRLVKSRSVLEPVIESLSLNMSYEGLSSKVSVTNPSDTRVLEITVTHSNPESARLIADEIRVKAAEFIVKTMSVDNVNTVDEASLPRVPSSPNTTRNVFIAVFIGILISAVVVVVEHMLNDNIKTPLDVDKYLGLTVLGIIPETEGNVRVTSKKRRKKLKKV